MSNINYDVLTEGKLGNFFKKLLGFNSDEYSVDNFRDYLDTLPDNQVKQIRNAIASFIKDKRLNARADDALGKISSVFDQMSPEQINSMLKRMNQYADKTLADRQAEIDQKKAELDAKYDRSKLFDPEPIQSEEEPSQSSAEEEPHKKFSKKYINIDPEKLKQFTVAFDNIRHQISLLSDYIHKAKQKRDQVKELIANKDFARISDVLSSMEVGDKVNLKPVEGQTEHIKDGDYVVATKDENGKPVIRFGTGKEGEAPIDILREDLRRIIKIFNK